MKESEDLKMKVAVTKTLFEKIPGLCIGVIAVRAVNNEKDNKEAEAFRRRCCTEANLLFKLNPKLGEKDRDLYTKHLKELGITEKTALDLIFEEYKNQLGITASEEKETTDTLAVGRTVTLDELAGSDVLERVNPVTDIVRAGMLKFHVNIHAYDLGDRKAPLEIGGEEGYPVTWKGEICTQPWLSGKGNAAKITGESENILVLITGFADNRKRVAAARNELARRMKSAFDRAVEVGWLEGKETEFETEI